MTSREEALRLLSSDVHPEEKPRYSVARAGHYLHIAPSTLRSWVRGRTYVTGAGKEDWPPVIRAGHLLTFNNLIEAYVLRALRVDHGVKMSAVRKALEYAERKYNIPRLLLSEQLQATPGNVFLERFGELINLGRAGQLANKALLDAVLTRVERNPAGLPHRMFPTASYDVEALKRAPKLVMISPAVSFGRPIMASKGIRTWSIVSRINADEKPEDVARDYGLELQEIEAAIFYERAAA
jgi:uncharacterized protein (DUF433 family)